MFLSILKERWWRMMRGFWPTSSRFFFFFFISFHWNLHCGATHNERKNNTLEHDHITFFFFNLFLFKKLARFGLWRKWNGKQCNFNSQQSCADNGPFRFNPHRRLTKQMGPTAFWPSDPDPRVVGKDGYYKWSLISSPFRT